MCQWTTTEPSVFLPAFSAELAHFQPTTCTQVFAKMLLHHTKFILLSLGNGMSCDCATGAMKQQNSKAQFVTENADKWDSRMAVWHKGYWATCSCVKAHLLLCVCLWLSIYTLSWFAYIGEDEDVQQWHEFKERLIGRQMLHLDSQSRLVVQSSTQLHLPHASTTSVVEARMCMCINAWVALFIWCEYRGLVWAVSP